MKLYLTALLVVFTSVVGHAETLNGIDVLERDGFKMLRGQKVGLITNHTGIDRQRRPTIDLLHAGRRRAARGALQPGARDSR